MTELEELKNELNIAMCNTIENLRAVNSTDKNNDIVVNVNIGYLKGLRKCFELIDGIEHDPFDLKIKDTQEDTQEDYPEYFVGETVLYQNGNKFELGIIKSVCLDSENYIIDEYFVWYHTGDTAARTHARHLHKISNDYAFKIIRLDPDGKERRDGDK